LLYRTIVEIGSTTTLLAAVPSLLKAKVGYISTVTSELEFIYGKNGVKLHVMLEKIISYEFGGTYADIACVLQFTLTWMLLLKKLEI
jgi:hypothetical protein